MPANFTLTSKAHPEDGPARLSKIDDDMREHFHAPPDDLNAYESWYSTIGFALAVGRTWDEIRESFPEKLEIINWLDEHYTPNSWVRVGR